jgi:hypothetical protein
VIEDLTIIIQGRHEVEQMRLWISNYSNWNIIVSVWEDFDMDTEIPSNWKLIKSKYPERFGEWCQNVDLQIVSTLNGLKEVNTKYVIKVRADEFYTSLDKVYNRIKEVHPKVVCSSIFFRPLYLYPFHISDHIIASTTEHIKTMFEKAYDNFQKGIRINTAPESHLGYGFLSAMENWNINEMGYQSDNLSEEAMRKWFNIFDVNELVPFTATENSPDGRIYYKDHFGYGSHNIKEIV